MPKYYINWNPWNNREPEVHVEGCVYLGRADSRYIADLGDYPDCHPAVEYAKSIIPSADGCAFCCTECDHDRTW